MLVTLRRFFAIMLCMCRSFGVLLWEMAAYGELPLPDVSNKDIHTMAENRTLHHPRQVLLFVCWLI